MFGISSALSLLDVLYRYTLVLLK